MFEARLITQAQYLDASRMRDLEHLCGQLTPWARLAIPDDIDDNFGFRLKRGTLLAFSTDKAFLYDIEKAGLQQTIEMDVLGSVMDMVIFRTIFFELLVFFTFTLLTLHFAY